jgi:hypothetical protein
MLRLPKRIHFRLEVIRQDTLLPDSIENPKPLKQSLQRDGIQHRSEHWFPDTRQVQKEPPAQSGWWLFLLRFGPRTYPTTPASTFFTGAFLMRPDLMQLVQTRIRRFSPPSS